MGSQAVYVPCQRPVGSTIALGAGLASGERRSADRRRLPAPSAALAPSRLDEGSLLDRGAWARAFPGAGEAVIVSGLVRAGASGSAERVRGILRLPRGRPLSLDGRRRAADAQNSSNDRRARARARRFIVANGLNRLLTVTYAPPQPTDVGVVLADCARFERRLRQRLPGVVWARALERHESGAIHVHYALSGYVSKELLARLWGRGFVDVRKIRAAQQGGRESARAAARYVTKYISKAPTRAQGGHRYEVRQGFQPEEVRLAAWSSGEAVRALVEAFGAPPSYEWTSSGDPDWNGPPVRYLAFP